MVRRLKQENGHSLPGKNVHLSFLTFEMEDEQDCGYDFIEVFSGYDDQGPSYGRFCGNAVGGGVRFFLSFYYCHFNTCSGVRTTLH